MSSCQQQQEAHFVLLLFLLYTYCGATTTASMIMTTFNLGSSSLLHPHYAYNIIHYYHHHMSPYYTYTSYHKPRCFAQQKKRPVVASFGFWKGSNSQLLLVMCGALCVLCPVEYVGCGGQARSELFCFCFSACLQGRKAFSDFFEFC